ncbi:kinase, partial [Thraustotheca clavata]
GVLSEVAVKHIARQLLSGIQACHEKDIIHRDIKLENILVTAMDGDILSVQIADFGLSINAKHPLSRCCGTPFYMAPEVASGNLYGTVADMWSLGVVIYCLLTDEIPEAGSLHELDFSCMTKAAKDFILAMLQENPHKRATATTLLNHTWFMDQSELTVFVQKFSTFIHKRRKDMVSICGRDYVDGAILSLEIIAKSLSVDDMEATQLVQLVSQVHSTLVCLEELCPTLRDLVISMA